MYLSKLSSHYENLPMQYTEIFSGVKFEDFIEKILILLLFLLKTLIVGTRGGSNKYPQSMFWSKNKKNCYTPANPSFAI